MGLASNARYKVAFQNEHVTLYMPVDLSDYHKSREIALQEQERYANAGITKDVLRAVAERAIERINKEQALDTLRTDMAVLWNNLLARTADPVDELCTIRMGALACFLENENPDKVVPAFTANKIALAEQHPDIYAFFLDMGVAFTPAYNSLLRSLNVEDYLVKRKQMLGQLTLQNTPATG